MVSGKSAGYGTTEMREAKEGKGKGALVKQTFDLAIWLTRFSPWPDVVEFIQVDLFTLPLEAAQAYMQEHNIPIAFKVAVNTGKQPIRRFYHVKVEQPEVFSNV